MAYLFLVGLEAARDAKLVDGAAAVVAAGIARVAPRAFRLRLATAVSHYVLPAADVACSHPSPLLSRPPSWLLHPSTTRMFHGQTDRKTSVFVAWKPMKATL